MISGKNIRIGLVAGAVVFAGLLLVSGTKISLGTVLLIGLVALFPLDDARNARRRPSARQRRPLAANSADGARERGVDPPSGSLGIDEAVNREQ